MRFRRHLLTVVLGIGLSGCQGAGAQTESASLPPAHSRVTKFDITSRDIPTVHHLLERADRVEHARTMEGREIGTVDDVARNSLAADQDRGRPWLLAPIDLQAIKASGVTFVTSLLERVIEEQARGDPAAAVGRSAKSKSDRLFYPKR